MIYRFLDKWDAIIESDSFWFRFSIVVAVLLLCVAVSYVIKLLGEQKTGG